MATSFKHQQVLNGSRRTSFSTLLTAPVRVPRPSNRPAAFSNQPHRRVVVRAAEEQVATQEPARQQAAATPAGQDDSEWVAVCRPEDLPKGTRKEVDIDARPVLLFWYRNAIFAIEGRSPAEGAYSEGFIKAKFTQDYCIECPSTGSLFSLKDGSIQSWYPNNPVLRALTPSNTCRPMEVYPVKLAQEAIYVDVSRARATVPRVDRGGAGSSLENNNVFTVQPNVYFEGQDSLTESASLYAVDKPPTRLADINPATLTVGALALGIVGVAGTATAIYAEVPTAGIIGYWVVLGGVVAATGYNILNKAVPLDELDKIGSQKK